MACARALVDEGARVVLARDERPRPRPGGRARRRRGRGRRRPHPWSRTPPPWSAAALERFGRLDVLVNNAGMTSTDRGLGRRRGGRQSLAARRLARLDLPQPRHRVPREPRRRPGDARAGLRAHRHGVLHHRDRLGDARAGVVRRGEGGARRPLACARARGGRRTASRSTWSRRGTSPPGRSWRSRWAPPTRGPIGRSGTPDGDRGRGALPRARVGVVRHRGHARGRRRALAARDLAGPAGGEARRTASSAVTRRGIRLGVARPVHRLRGRCTSCGRPPSTTSCRTGRRPRSPSTSPPERSSSCAPTGW